jgi:enoyl-CoA hydratase/carnithine racemase
VSKVSYNVDERGIAVMKINNPPMNALDEQVMFEMEDCARRIPSDERVR